MSRKHFKNVFSRQYEKDWINWICYDFSVNHDSIAVSDILDIHKYLMKKDNTI